MGRKFFLLPPRCATLRRHNVFSRVIKNVSRALHVDIANSTCMAINLSPISACRCDNYPDYTCYTFL